MIKYAAEREAAIAFAIKCATDWSKQTLAAAGLGAGVGAGAGAGVYGLRRLFTNKKDKKNLSLLTHLGLGLTAGAGAGALGQSLFSRQLPDYLQPYESPNYQDPAYWQEHARKSGYEQKYPSWFAELSSVPDKDQKWFDEWDKLEHHSELYDRSRQAKDQIKTILGLE